VACHADAGYFVFALMFDNENKNKTNKSLTPPLTPPITHPTHTHTPIQPPTHLFFLVFISQEKENYTAMILVPMQLC
jgi:hypothetical protein